jgi:hypothetical protein
MLSHNVFGSSIQLQSLQTVAACWMEGWQSEGKIIPMHATKPYEEWGTSPLIHNLGSNGTSDRLHSLVALFPEEELRVPTE